MVSAVIRSLLPFFLLCGCLSASAQSPLIDSIIHPDSCRRIVETLAADSFMGRFTGSPMGEQAGIFIADEFRKAGCAPGGNRGSFLVPFVVSYGGRGIKANNVVAVLRGKTRPTEWVIFSAHYDHVGTKSTSYFSFADEKGRPEKGDTIYNGANDNASGVSALILLARYFAAAKNNERTIVFTAFSGEELGLLGSMHVSQLMKNFDSVVAMINMDMVGVPLTHNNIQPFVTGSEHSDLRTILNKTLYRMAPGKFAEIFFYKDSFKSEKLFSRSDNYWFARQGVPAHTIIATHPRHRFYHSLNDEPKTLDYVKTARVIQALAIGSAGLIDGTESPTRINPLNITPR